MLEYNSLIAGLFDTPTYDRLVLSFGVKSSITLYSYMMKFRDGIESNL